MKLVRLAVIAVVLWAGAGAALAESGGAAWLRYAPLDQQSAEQYSSLPAVVVTLGDSETLRAARQELVTGVRSMLGRNLRLSETVPAEPAIVLATFTELHKGDRKLQLPRDLSSDGYWYSHAQLKGVACLIIAGASDRGVLYGVFGWLSKVARGESVIGIEETQQPYAPLRWINQWDNLDGTIERGYAGASVFFERGRVRSDLTRAGQYARLLASIGINGCTINNVNADPHILAGEFLPQLVRIADVFRPWGVQLSLSVDLSAPKVIGGLDTFDPLDPKVAEWWNRTVDELYRRVPDFGGFVMKADSEGRPGPATYGRTPADAANVVARALRRHGGVVFYRAFVYNHHLDWRNLKNDRAKAAYDIFHPLDGKFDENVIVQIKYGPIDFQVREPVSPLLGALRNTNEAIELQITQEYTGQQRHLCFLVPMWKEILDFDLHADPRGGRVKDLVAGKVFHRPYGGFAGVANVGMDANWMSHPLAMANVYGFGRLAWDPNLTAGAIVDEWSRLTFGNDPLVLRTLAEMQLSSWHTYESYTGPLGVGTLTDILGSHYGPGPESSERNGWGQWHRADQSGIGMDRTIATGTGFVAQYSPEVQKLYESVANCPDNLLVFFHHVSYTHLLHNGKTVIQYMYDAHYEGASQAQDYVRQWQMLEGHVDEERFAKVLELLKYQAGHAVVWRDAICNWLHRLSGIPDKRGRVGEHPYHLEAEDMQLEGYLIMNVQPWEAASQGKDVECPESAQMCAATFRFKGAAGSYQLDIQYFDLNNGASKFQVYVNQKPVDHWSGAALFPAAKVNGDSSTRRRIPGLALRPGDELRVEGVPGGEEHAPLDYFEIRPSPNRSYVP